LATIGTTDGRQPGVKKILVIEDDQRIAFALCVRLKANGYATWMAADSLTGFHLAMRHRPDLIVLDIALPGGDGFALAERFSQLQETRAIPIIIATASKQPDLREKILELGACGLLRKPYEPEELLEIVHEVLAATTLPDPAKTRGPVTGGPEARRVPKILIVEDDEQIARALALRMQAAGFDAAVAHDALAGVRCAMKTKPDVVVLDISLPAGDGFTVAERIQAHIPTHIPIIFLTASQRPDLRQRAQQLGAVAFFEKPYEAAELLAAVRQAVG
jgi:DNA-binding response OmpR family regulator